MADLRGAFVPLPITAADFFSVPVVTADGLGWFLVPNGAGRESQPTGLFNGGELNIVSSGNGPELVSNGDFSGGTPPWILGAGWQIAAGVAQSDGSNGNLTQTLALTPGNTYRITFDIVAGATFAGSGLDIHLGGGPLAQATAVGAQSFDVVAGAGAPDLQFFVAPANDFVGQIDNVSVVEVGGGALDSVQVIAGLGAVIDSYTNPNAAPTIQPLKWPQIDQVIAFPFSDFLVHTSIQDTGVPDADPLFNVGQLMQRNTRLTPAQMRDEIYLGYIQSNLTDAWQDISSPVVANNNIHTLIEFLNDIAGPFFIVDGGDVSENSPAFTLDFSEGVVWQQNRNWHVNRKDPNREILPAQSPLLFRSVTSDGQIVSAQTTAITSAMDPTQYENPLGTLTGVPGGAKSTTVQRLYIDAGNNFWILWGQNVYDNFLEAIGQIGVDTESTEIPDFLGADSVLLGYVVCENSQTDWVDEASQFIPVTSVAAGGGGDVPVSTFVGLLDTPSGYAAEGGKYTRVNVAESGLEFTHDPAEWQGPWAVGTYQKNDMVRDLTFLMIANKITSDRAAPQAIEPQHWVLPDDPVWDTANFSGVVQTGTRATNFTGLHQVTKVRVWIEDTSADATYRLTFIDNVTGEVQVGEQIKGDAVSEPQWIEIVQSLVLVPGSDVTVTVLQENHSATTDTTEPWVWLGQTQADDDPGAGNADTNNQINKLRINDLDDNAVDQSTLLTSVIAGTIIRVEEQGDATAFYDFEVLFSTDMIGWWQFDVIRVDTGSGGAPAALELCDLTFIVPTPAPTTYVTLPDFFLGSQFFTGLLKLGNGPVTENDDAHGIDVFVQEFAASPDWDVMLISGGGAIAGGGSSDFTGLTDTPNEYSGDSLLSVRVNAAETALEFFTPAASGATAFTGLTDTPASYAGAAGRGLEVNVGETALEFVNLIRNFLDLPDTPITYAGQQGKVATVNNAEDAIEFNEAQAAFGPVVNISGVQDATDSQRGSIFQNLSTFAGTLNLDQITLTNWSSWCTSTFANTLTLDGNAADTSGITLRINGVAHVFDSAGGFQIPLGNSMLLTRISSTEFAGIFVPSGGGGSLLLDTLAIEDTADVNVTLNTGSYVNWGPDTWVKAGLDAGKTYEVRVSFGPMCAMSAGSDGAYRVRMSIDGGGMSHGHEVVGRSRDSTEYNNVGGFSIDRFTGKTGYTLRMQGQSISGPTSLRYRGNSWRATLYEIT